MCKIAAYQKILKWFFFFSAEKACVCSSLLSTYKIYKSLQDWQFHETDLIITADDLSVWNMAVYRVSRFHKRRSRTAGPSSVLEQ